MDEHEENFKDIFRYTDVEYTPDGYTDVYRWDDFLVIAGDHVYSAMDTIDSVSPGGEYEGSTRNMPTPARSSGAAICSTATRPPRAPCTYRPRPSARPFATERPSPGSISTMETNRSRLRSSSSRSSPNAVRALCRWLPRLGPPRGTRVARTVASGPDARYNRCGR